MENENNTAVTAAEAPVFSAETRMTITEYKEYNHIVSEKISKIWIITAVMEIMLAAVGLYMIGKNMSIAIGIFIGAVLFPIFLFFRLDSEAEKVFRSNKLMQNELITMNFYSDRVESSSIMGNSIIEYDKIYRIIETKTHFYIMVAKNQGLIVVKRNCTPQLISFIEQLMKEHTK